MRILLQRVTHGAVQVEDQIVGRIDHGFVALLGVGQDDTEAQAAKLVDKLVNLRVFNDEQGKFNRSLLDVGGGVLLISQFTLYADARKGRRPSFTAAARPEQADPLCQAVARMIRDKGVHPVETGVFGAHMHVTIHNDGPVTIWLDSEELG
jgi:D-tyrosyl-tRNA(Tyr) deacylase